MTKCPQCSGDHSLSQCPNWRLLPVALAPHIKDAIRASGHFMPESLWAAIIAAHDLVAPRTTAEKAGGLSQDAARYQLLRRKVCIAGGKFHILNLDPIYLASHAEIELDAAIDAQILATKE